MISWRIAATALLTPMLLGNSCLQSMGKDAGATAAVELRQGLENIGKGIERLDPVALKQHLDELLKALRENRDLTEANKKLQLALDKTANADFAPYEIDLAVFPHPFTFRIWFDADTFEAAKQEGKTIAEYMEFNQIGQKIMINVKELQPGRHVLHVSGKPPPGKQLQARGYAQLFRLDNGQKQPISMFESSNTLWNGVFTAINYKEDEFTELGTKEIYLRYGSP